MESENLSKGEQEFLCRVHSYVEGDISRPLFYMDIVALAREMDASKDDVYVITQKLRRHGLIEVEVAGYLEVVMVKLTPKGGTLVKELHKQ
ncbi:MAG: hypothetical protein ACXVJJ_02705 [Halobacteriota archaeon]